MLLLKKQVYLHECFVKDYADDHDKCFKMQINRFSNQFDNKHNLQNKHKIITIVDIRGTP